MPLQAGETHFAFVLNSVGREFRRLANGHSLPREDRGRHNLRWARHATVTRPARRMRPDNLPLPGIVRLPCAEPRAAQVLEEDRHGGLPSAIPAERVGALGAVL